MMEIAISFLLQLFQLLGLSVACLFLIMGISVMIATFIEEFRKVK